MQYLALTIPGYTNITSPSYIPQYANRFTALNNFLFILFILITFIAIGFIIWGGIQIILSEGDKQKLQAARGKVTAAVLGLIIAFVSFLLVQAIGYFFGLNSDTFNILNITF